MKTYNQLPFPDKIKWRIRLLWFLFIFMIIYMVFVSVLGGGDSRIMTPLANFVSDVILFGGMFAVLHRIRYNKKLLANRLLLKEKYLNEKDERNHYLHDKSGGIAVDILLLVLLFITTTCALFDMPAFYVSLTILVVTIALKGGLYCLYCRNL